MSGAESRAGAAGRLSPREGLGSALFAAGAGAVLVSLSVEFLQWGAPGYGWVQVRLIQLGVAAAAAGAGLDVFLGPRRLGPWLRSVFPSLRHLLLFLGIAAQAWLLARVFDLYAIESAAFSGRVFPIAFAGFLLHHLLPASWRLWFFVLLSGCVLFVVLGAGNAAWVGGLGMLLVGLCHLPVPFWWRAGLLAAAGGALAAWRGGWINAPVPVPALIWPVLGSLFMFRLMVFLYDKEHEKKAAPFAQRLAYFFPLPNVVFSLFPVVDYKTFRRTYYGEDWPGIYQRGVTWMFRGLIHLLLYRLVNTHLVIASEEVTNAATLAQYLTANFALYLRVSGQFHLIIGLLHLFGFHLPLTNQHYFLASSFTDFWRRINIYWKDFMMKVFYYPAYFRLTRLGPNLALVLATLWVFLVTWFLHAYQWFWLRGSFLLSLTDMLFWTILALLVVANSLYEAKYGRRRSLGKAAWTPKTLALLGLRTSATFAAICALWSLWTSASVGEWLAVWRAGAGIQGLGILLAVFLIPGLAAVGVQWAASSALALPGAVQRMQRWAVAPVTTAAALAFLAGVTLPALAPGRDTGVHSLISDLRAPRLSRRDSDLLRRGYYENLTPTNDIASPLWQTLMNRPRNLPTIDETAAVRKAEGFLNFELAPGVQISFRDQPLTTNRWGMRDRDYEQAKPPGVYRVVLLGSSHVMGTGVADGESFEALLEERVNSAQGAARLELLNFAVGNYSALQALAVLERKALPFAPDAAVFVAHPSEFRISRGFLVGLAARKAVAPYDWLRGIMERAGLSRSLSPTEAGKNLQPYLQEVTREFNREWVALCRARGVRPVWVLLPSGVGEDLPPEETQILLQLARASGFTVVDLMDVYDGHDPASLYLAEWDRHPNRRGHQVIANRLYQLLQKDPHGLLPGFSPAGQAHRAPVPAARQ